MTPETNQIYAGECCEVMKTWPANFVDTLITDPPYGIGFMAKDWDHGIPGIHFWADMLRIAKPGAMLLAFGGTRTFHRLTVAIEDAGWQIRDCLMWLYSSGFPKSHNFGCKCGGQNNGQTNIEHSLRPVRQGDVPASINAEDERGEVLLDSLPEPRSSELWPKGAEPETSGQEQSSMAGRDIHRAGQGLSNGAGSEPSKSQGERLRTGARIDSRKNGGTVPGSVGGSSPHRQGEAEQRSKQLENLSDAQSPLDSGTCADDGRCPTCGGLTAFKGFGTALKPAWEPIIVAMKPLDGTFAENAEKWGVAGINVDGGRIGTSTSDDYGRSATNAKGVRVLDGKTMFNGLHSDDGQYANDKGRWPANLILDEAAAGMLDGASGATISKPSGYNFDSSNNDNPTHVAHNIKSGVHFGDSGGASRFFYVAKSCRAERNEGCEGLPRKPAGMLSENSGQHLTRRDGDAPGPAANHHPTVKPLELMKYLCMLTKTPTGGLVLDPFAGSGTTLWAAEFHNRPWIGIEMNPEYVAIANARIARERSQMKMAI